MRSPKDMRTIQIDITNACVNSCSNCTRFCGHHRKPFFMDWETFKRAVDSLKDFSRRVGVMGGEPTLHPQFDRFVRYLSQKYPSKFNLPSLKRPIKTDDFIDYIRDRNFYLDETLNDRKGPGLFTSLCRNYYEHYELIQDVFSYQCINDHQNPCKHQPLLVSRKELGVSDDEWLDLRDKCWIQNTWSATITPKGAFFCEVAGALDMLFDGPGGWPIEPGWWKRDPKDFGYQLQWCEICGGALFNEGRIAKEEIDDVSPMLYEKLQRIESPKVKKSKVNILNMKNPKIDDENMPNTSSRYLTDYQKRISKDNTVLNPKTIGAIIFCNSNRLENLNVFIDSFDTIAVVAIEEDVISSLQEIVSKYVHVKVVEPVCGEWGRTLNKAIKSIDSNDWLCIIDDDAEVPVNICTTIKQMAINPGCLYSFNIPMLKEKLILFNKRASALKYAGFDGVSGCRSISEFVNIWDDSKQIILEHNFDTVENPDLEEWYNFADNIAMENKEHLYKCLNKISNDLKAKNDLKG